MEGHRDCARSVLGLRGEPRGADDVRHQRHDDRVRRVEPCLDHRRLPAITGGDGRESPQRRRSRRVARRCGRRSRDRRDRLGLLDGRRRGARRRARRCVPNAWCAPRRGRGTRRARTRGAVRPGPPPRGDDVEGTRIARRCGRRPADVHRSAGQPGAPVHLLHSTEPGRRRRCARGARRGPQRRGGRTPATAPRVDRPAGPRPPVADHPGRHRRRG